MKEKLVQVLCGLREVCVTVCTDRHAHHGLRLCPSSLLPPPIYPPPPPPPPTPASLTARRATTTRRVGGFPRTSVRQRCARLAARRSKWERVHIQNASQSKTSGDRRPIPASSAQLQPPSPLPSPPGSRMRRHELIAPDRCCMVAVART
ncbi:unnamed protein product [Pleuronectes platessa]|uniref:Uncharacterized protein n=1 Tax=Pleuronectes platessa TaxID=8262 RepID=A0A9N7TGB0_PLEPL|nr:unnamed protein product [Pleuronectes platessa]